MKEIGWRPSRRTFLQGLAGVAGVGLVPSAKGCESGVEYVGRSECIEVVLAGKTGRRTIQSVPSERPASLVLSAHRHYLLAVNHVGEYRGLPTGSVESYSVEPVSGKLALMSRQSLSLSATFPREVAIAPDERWIVVAAYGGGAYNVVPLSVDGALGRVTQVVKEIGSGPDPEKQRAAHPHSLLFHPSGRFLFASDLGSDRITVFRYAEGRLTRVNTVTARPGSGPAQMTLDVSGKLLLVAHELEAFTSLYSFEAVSGALTYRERQLN